LDGVAENFPIVKRVPSMPQLYPLRFEPILRRYIWGGRRLAELGKRLGPESDYAESWEVVDRGADQSLVQSGPLAGISLGQLVQSHGRELLGRHHPRPRFPLLFKFLDARRQLSLQVHPADHQAALLSPPDLGKTEAWVILQAEPGSFIYAGLQPGVDRPRLASRLGDEGCEKCFHRYKPRPGDCIFLPAGVVHALGPGLLVAEVQQSSDTTYRLFDWNRPGSDGQPRPLHIDEALKVIDFDYGPVAPQLPLPSEDAAAERLVACDKFVLDRRRLVQSQALGGDDRFHILAVLEGTLQLHGDPAGEPMNQGDVALLPAALSPTTATPLGGCTLLDMYLP